MIGARVASRALMSRFSASQILAKRVGQPARYSSTATATVADAGFWRSLIPKPLRGGKRKGLKPKGSREWNPATFFIIMFLFIGSMSIQMIALRNQTERYVRQSSVRLGQLRDALEKMRRGESVDVEKLLSAAEAPKEADWEEVLRALEQEEPSQEKQVAAPSQLHAKAKEVPLEANTNEPAERPKSTSVGSFF